MSHIGGDAAICLHLRVVPHPAQQRIGHAGGAAGTPGNGQRSCRRQVNIQQIGRAVQNLAQFVCGVVIEAVDKPESGAQRSGEHAGAGSCTHQRELGQIQLYGAGIRALVDDDVEPEILHGRVEVFLNSRVETVNFINEEHIALFHIGQDARQVACFFNLRTTGGVELAPYGPCYDVGQGGFAQTGRPAEQYVVEHITAHAGGFHHEHETLFHLFLPAEFTECRRAQR